jgi:hypothetical protein
MRPLGLREIIKQAAASAVSLALVSPERLGLSYEKAHGAWKRVTIFVIIIIIVIIIVIIFMGHGPLKIVIIVMGHGPLGNCPSDRVSGGLQSPGGIGQQWKVYGVLGDGLRAMRTWEYPRGISGPGWKLEAIRGNKGTTLIARHASTRGQDMKDAGHR